MSSLLQIIFGPRRKENEMYVPKTIFNEIYEKKCLPIINESYHYHQKQ